jgi:hypothetical protein
MKNSDNKKIFVNLNDFSSGCTCLSLTFSNQIDYFSKNDFLTEYRFLLSIQTPQTIEHQRYPFICRWICSYEEAHGIDKQVGYRTSK